jgi:hypothetical protein
VHRSTPPEGLQGVTGVGTPDSDARHDVGAEQRAVSDARRARMASAIVRHKGRRGSRMASMRAQPTSKDLSAPTSLASPALLPVRSNGTASNLQQQAAGRDHSGNADAQQRIDSMLDDESTAVEAAKQFPLGKRNVVECYVPVQGGDSRNPVKGNRSCPCIEDLQSMVDMCMHDAFQVSTKPSDAAAVERSMPDRPQERARSVDGSAREHCCDSEKLDGYKIQVPESTGVSSDSSTHSLPHKHSSGIALDVEKRAKSRRRDNTKAVLGVRLLWIARNHRGKGLAEHLLDVARQDVRFTLGRAATRQEVAWASWLVDALGFASQYCEGPEHVLLFNELHCASEKN